MKKNERPAATTLHIVQANPVDLDEPSLGGIVALRLLGKLPIYEGRRGQKKSSCSGNRDNGVSTQRSVARCVVGIAAARRVFFAVLIAPATPLLRTACVCASLPVDTPVTGLGFARLA